MAKINVVCGWWAILLDQCVGGGQALECAADRVGEAVQCHLLSPTSCLLQSQRKKTFLHQEPEFWGPTYLDVPCLTTNLRPSEYTRKFCYSS